jgi:hypothetical protein
LIAVWSRPLTVVYFAALAWAALDLPPDVRRRRIALAMPVVVLTLAVPLILNTLKFGNPFDSGYEYIYIGRTDFIAERAAHGLFGLRFVPDNIEHMTLGFPWFERREAVTRVHHDPFGAGLWWTSPLLLYVIVAAPAWWRDRARRRLLVPVACIVAAHLLYHNTGWLQPGYNRFSLDYIVVLLAVIAPFAFIGVYRWVSFGLIAWSVWYFQWITLAR